MQYTGTLRKMAVAHENPVSYQLRLGEQAVTLNEHLNQKIRLEFTQNIYCVACQRKTNKSFNQGYCFPCMRSLAQCDICIVRPEKCHFHEGTCREPQWGLDHCMQDHIVYLANTSGIKVGITRKTQIPTRFIDQGAYQALPIFQVKSRQIAGFLEVKLNQCVADKTNWRVMLKGTPEACDLVKKAHELDTLCQSDILALKQQFGDDAIMRLSEAELLQMNYPVIEYPQKMSSFNFDKNPVIEAVLKGIKGQYLLFDSGIINIRKFAGYEVQFSY